MEESHFQNSANSGSDAEEEKYSHDKINTSDKNAESSEANNLNDDEFLMEFKNKYQQSLEAIQSFQEILELKKNFPNLKHSYNPPRRKERTELPSLKSSSKVLQGRSPQKPDFEPPFQLNFSKVQRLPQLEQTPSPLELFSQTERATNRRNFRIKDVPTKNSAEIASFFKTPRLSQTGFYTERSGISKDQKEDIPIQSAFSLNLNSAKSAYSPGIFPNSSTFSSRRLEAPHSGSKTTARLPKITSPLEQTENFDQVMGEPFSKIKIKNLKNYKAEPLEVYDQALMHQDEDPQELLNSGINRGFSKFLNPKGEIEWRDCEILSYLEDEKKFEIRWRHDGNTKKVTRLNLRYAVESEFLFEERVQKTTENRYKNLYMGSYREMIQERARQDPWMNYPMKSLNRIIQLAFQKFDHSEESETVVTLVDQLMDHYKEEITKFSMEINSFQPDFSTFMKKFKDAYRLLKNTAVRNQDKAIEIVNMPYKEYREYKDWGDNVIIDAEEMDTAKLKVFHDPSSHVVFYQSIAKHSKLRMSQSAEFLIQICESLTFQNFLTLNETIGRSKATVLTYQRKQSLAMKEENWHLLREDTNVTEEINPKDYLDRAVLTRRTRLVDVKKLKTENKFHKKLPPDNSNMSSVIQVFQQTITQILPKPLEFTSKFFVMVSALMRQLSEIRIFRALKPYRKSNIISNLDKLKILSDEFNTDANKIDLYIYRVQQCVDELKVDIKILKSEALERETLKRVCDFSTTMAHDATKICIKESLESLMEDLEEYYALLPLPVVSQDILEKLPKHILNKREKYRQYLHLKSDNDDILKTDLLAKPRQLSETTSQGVVNTDKELIREIILFIMNDLLNVGDLYKEGFIQTDLLRIKPLFLIKYTIKEKQKSVHKTKIKMTRQDRARQRLTSRENIFQFEEFKDRLLSDNYRNDEAPEVTIKVGAATKERFVGKDAFSWFKLGRAEITHEPHIYDVEQKLKKILMSAFDIFPKLERIDTAPPPNENFMTLDGLEDALMSCRFRLDELFRTSLLPLFALFSILHNFEFLLTQDKHYTSDVKDSFNESDDKNIATICYEIEQLQNDLDFLSTKIPAIFHLGFLMLDISEYVAKLKKNIEKYLNVLKEFLQFKLEEIITSNRAIVTKIEERLSKGALVIDHYIELKIFLESEELKLDFDNIKESIDISQLIVNYMEDFNILYNPDVLDVFYMSKGWIQTLNKAKMDAQVQLEAARPRLINELKQKNEQIFKELEGIKIDISNYANHYDLANAQNYFHNARDIMTRLDELMEYGTKCNFYEEMLFARKTDWSGIEGIKENFDKFYLLWEFIYDKWMIKSDYWLNLHFENLDVQDMEDIIQEGLKLLNLLEEKFRNNINILDLVRSYLREVSRFKDYLDLLKKLKSETFKPRHWDLLWSEMYSSLATKPDPKLITLKKLLEDKLFTYASLINTIYKNAQEEYNIEQEIERIEEGVMKIKDLNAYPYDVGKGNDVFIMKGIGPVISKLQDFHFYIKNMLSNSNYPRAFLDRLTSLDSIIKGVKKLMKLARRIQKKVFIIAPIMRHRFIIQFFGKDKDHEPTFNQIHTQYKQQVEAIIKGKKMHYLVALFDRMTDMSDKKKDASGEDLIENFKKIDAKCDIIISDLYLVIRQLRSSCARLHLLTDYHLIEYMSVVAEPKEVVRDLSWLFSNVKEIKIDSSGKNPLAIYGLVNTLHETLTFTNRIPINPQDQDGSNFYIPALLNEIEKELKQSVRNNLIKFMPVFFENAYNFANNFKLFKEKNVIFQNLILLTNVLFYHDMTMIIGSKQYVSENARESFIANKLKLFKTNIEHNLATLCELFRYERDRFWFLLLNQYIFHIKYQLEILNYVIESDVQSLDAFEFLIIPKTMLEYNAKAVKSSEILTSTVNASKSFLETTSSIQDFNLLNTKSDFLHSSKSAEPGNYNIIIKSFYYKRNYGFSLLPFTEPVAFAPSTNRCYVTMLGALATQSGVIVHGLQDQGKKETVKSLAYLVGKETFIVDQYATDYNYLTQVIFGTPKGGFWIIFDNLQDYSSAVLSTMAQQIQMIRNTLANGDFRVKYGSSAFDLRGDQNWAFFATYSSRQTGELRSLNTLPKNFSENFRILNFINPHLSQIIFLYYDLYGVQYPHEAANRTLTFLQILSNTAENQHFFSSEKITLQDIEDVQALNIKPSMNLITKIMKNLQTMIVSQTVLKISALEIWKAIRKSLAPFTQETSSKIILNLFNTVFQSEIVNVSEQEEELEVDFKEMLEKYKKEHNIPNTNKFDSKCSELFTILNTLTPQYKTVLINGKVGSGKTLVLEATAHILSDVKTTNFCLNWIDLDSTPSTLVLGGEYRNSRVQGLLPIFIEVAVNEMKSADIQEYQYADLVRHCSQWAQHPTPQSVLSQSRLYDWIIFEGIYDQMNADTVNVIDRLIAGKKQGMITALDGYKIRIPKTMNVVIECDKMTALNPANLADVMLISINTNIFTIEQQFDKKIAVLAKFGDYFLHHQSLLKNIFKEIIEPVINHAEQEYSRQQGLIYYLSETHLLTNFLSIFEIFLNECRKIEISFGNITEDEIERAEEYADTNPIRKAPSANFEDKKSSLAVSKGDIMGIRHSMRLEISHNAAQTTDRQSLMIESSCIFCLIWTVGILYKPEYRTVFSKQLIGTVKNYYKDNYQELLDSFPSIFFLKFFGQKPNSVNATNLGIFDYCFDLQTQRWAPWHEITLLEHQEISPEFIGVRLPAQELVKFNPALKKSSHSRAFMQTDLNKRNLPLVKDELFVQTETSKKLLFFLDYFIAYKKPVVIMSEYQNGKTSAINHKLKLMLENNASKTYSFAITPLTTKEKLSQDIQTSFIRNSRGGYSPSLDLDGLIFIDDLNLSSISSKPWSLLKSFANHKGWYDLNKNSFIKLDRTSFIAALSYSFLNKQQQQSDNTLPPNIPQEFLQKMILHYMPEMTTRDMKAIFKEFSEPLVNQAEGKPYFKTLKSFINQFLIFNYRNKDRLQTLSNLLGCNLMITTALQMFKKLEFWNWDEETSQQSFLDLWFLSLKMIYGSQFEKSKPLPNEFVLEIEAMSIKSFNSENKIPASNNTSMNKIDNQNIFANTQDENVAKSSIFDDPLKHIRKQRKQKTLIESENRDSDESEITERKPRRSQRVRTLGQIGEFNLESHALIHSKDIKIHTLFNLDQKTSNASSVPTITNQLFEMTSPPEPEQKSNQETKTHLEEDSIKTQTPVVISLPVIQTRMKRSSFYHQQQEQQHERKPSIEDIQKSDSRSSVEINIYAAKEEDSIVVKESLQPSLMDIPDDAGPQEKPPLRKSIYANRKVSFTPPEEAQPEPTSTPTEIITLQPKKTTEKTRVSQFSSYSNQRANAPSEPKLRKNELHRSSFSRNSIENEIPDHDDDDQKSESDDSVSSVASSDSDERVNGLEKELDIFENQHLANLPSDYFNLLSQILIFSKNTSKITEEVARDRAFLFNTNILITEKEEIDYNNSRPVFELIHLRDQDKKDDILNYIQAEMVQHLADNKNGVLFFNNFTFRLSSVLPHLSSLLLELQTPSQSLFLTSRSQPLYCYHAVKFCSHILAFRIATLHLTPKKVSNTDIHNQFLTLFYDTLTISALEGRKCIFTMIVDTFKPGRVDISQDFLNKILQIFQDLNTIVLGGSLKTILSRQQIKTLFSILKKDPTYAQFSETHLFFVARQLVKNNIKFIIVAEDEALKINNLTFKFSKTPDQLTLVELFLKYFPQMYLQFRKIILDDLQLLVDKRVVLDEDIFPLNLDEKLCLIFQNSFNYEIQFGSLQDNTYGYSILPNFRIAILMADFVFSELKNNLNSKAEAQKGTGHNLIGAIRKLKKRCELLEGEIKDLRRFIQDRQHEITGVHQNTINLKLKKTQLGKEIDDINKQLMVFEEDLKGFSNEENILKKLQLAFSEVTNAILLYDSKLYMSDIKYAGFFTSKFFIVYAILWGQVCDLSPVEDKYANNLDLSVIKTGPFSIEAAQDYINKFYNLLNNFNELKDRILKFKFSHISTDELTTMITILKDNNLITSNMPFNKLQKSLMKWVDLVVEICKFELRRDFRLKEVFSIKTSSEELRVDLSARNKIFHHLELALEEQPRLLSQVNERVDYALQNIQGLETTIARMSNLAQDIETIIKANFELNNPCAANKVLYAEYIRAAALYMTQCSKYSAQVRPNIFKLILNNMNSELNFNTHRLHSILQGEGFLVDCLSKKIPMSLNFIDNISVFEMSFELNLQYPLVIDPSGLFLKYLQKKFAQKLVLELNLPSEATISNVSSAMEKGNAIVLVDFNKDLLNIIEPLLNWRYNQIISKLYNKHYYADQNQEKKADGQESDDEIHIVNQSNDQFEFNGVKCKVHPDFKLILLLQNRSFHISKFILEKVFIINNDIAGEETWSETVSDLILTTCYPTQREAAIIKYYNERSFSEANEQFNVLTEQIKKVDLLAPIENSVLEHLGSLAESVKRKYKIHTTPQQTTSSPLRSPNTLRKLETHQIQQPLTENSDLQDEPPKLRERSFSFLKKNKGETTLFRKGSVRSSFFIHSQSVAGSNNSPTSSPSPKKDPLKSRFFEGNQVQEFSSLYSNLPDLETILLKHSRFIHELFLLKTTAQLMKEPLGNIYSLSEQNILFNVQQALEITLLNGYFKNKATSADVEKFEAMVVFNAFQQLYSTFRKDHQNVFSFYFSILLLKSTENLNETIWRFILYRKIGYSAIQKTLLDPNTTPDWQDVSTFLSQFFELNDNKLSPLISFNPQAPIFANFRKLLPSLAHEDSILQRFLIEAAEAKTISINVPQSRKAPPQSSKQTPNSYMKSLLQGPKKEQSTPTKITSPTGFSNKINLLQLNQNEMPDLDLPKIALPKETSSPPKNYNFHSNMTDILSNKLQKSANYLVRNKHGAPIELGGSPMIPKQAYQFSFSETVEKQEAENPIANSPSQTKKSLFANVPTSEEEKQSPVAVASKTNLSDNDEEKDSALQQDSSNRKLMKGNRKVLNTLNASGEPNIVEDEVLLDNQALDSLKTTLPQIHGLFADMEKDLNRWTEFLNKSIFNFKQPNTIFPQMPNNWNKQFGALEIIALIKCLRPDALEIFIRGFLGETKHHSYFLMPKTNFESHARTNWFQRPTLVLFGDDSRNPVEHIELLALRNKNQCFKVALGATPIEIVIEEFARCCSIGKWFVLENFHLLADHHLPDFIKRINLELTKETTLASFKLWITYYQKDSSYGVSRLSKTSLLEPFFRTCFKVYFNISNSVKARLFELYKGNFQEFYTQLETDVEVKQNTTATLATNKPQASLQQKKNKQHRIRLQTSEEKIDMYSLFLPSSQSILKDAPQSPEPEDANNPMQDLCAKVKFTTTFLFAIITERLKFERPLQDKYSKNSISFVTENDLTDLLDDILNFAEKSSINPFTLVEKFFCFMYDYQSPTFMAFNNLNICYLFRTFVSNNPNFRPIQIKTTSYNMPQGQNISDLEIFQCLRSLPNEDPIQLFGYNTNHEMAYSYNQSQKMTDFLVKCNNQNSKLNAIQTERRELENIILNQKQEQELEVILEEYSTLKSDKTLIQNEDALRLASLLRKLNAFIPPCFDFRTIGYFEIYQAQPFAPQKNSQLKIENRLAPGLPVPRSFADTASNQNISLAIPSSGRQRRPSAGTNRDKFINEQIKSSFVEKFKKTPEASRKARKYSFTIVDSQKPTPGRTAKSRNSPAVSSNLDYESSMQLAESPSDPLNRIARSLERSRQPSIEKPTDSRNEVQLYQALFKNLMLHEIKLCNNVLKKIKQDLLHCLKIIQGSEHVASPQHNLVHALLKNQIPKDWYDINAHSLPYSATLISFLRVLDLKYENLKTLVKERECIIPPSIPLGKLFDPLFFFTGIIWTYSQHYKVPFNECQLVLQRSKTRPAVQQNYCGVIFISGLKINGGRVDERLDFLDDEFSKEFSSSLEQLTIKVTQKPKNSLDTPTDSSIPIIFKSKTHTRKRNDPEPNIVNDYHEYIKKYSSNKIEKPARPAKSIQFPVRIPLVDPCLRQLNTLFPLEFFFYVKSIKPQEYWQMKGTHLSFEIGK